MFPLLFVCQACDHCCRIKGILNLGRQRYKCRCNCSHDLSAKCRRKNKIKASGNLGLEAHNKSRFQIIFTLFTSWWVVEWLQRRFPPGWHSPLEWHFLPAAVCWDLHILGMSGGNWIYNGGSQRKLVLLSILYFIRPSMHTICLRLFAADWKQFE